VHIPDGFINGGTSAAAGVVAVAGLSVCVTKAAKTMDDKQVPMAGLAAAFIFAVQMLNFPVAGGTSGHLLGATLAAVLLGPWIACLVMAVVLVTQCFAFADGGVSALGANIVNMGVLGALLAGYLIKALMPILPKSRAAFLGIVGVTAWLAVMIGATATSFELAISDTVPLGTVLPAMLGVHALIGIGEAVITVAAVSAVLASRPDLVALGRFDAWAGAGAGADTAPAGSPS
jgi:cobalt/nickel transport system permease protein